MDLDRIALKLSRSENLPALSNVVIAVLKLVNDENTNAKDIEAIMEKDSGLTAKLLRAANSTYYGGYRVHSIDRAVTVLGLNPLKSVILALSFQSICGGTSKVKGFDKVAFWQHSFAAATAARILGKLLNPAKAEDLYSAAMMHDIGLVVMERFLPVELASAIELASTKDIELHKAEREILGYDHSDVGSILAEKWNLPEEIHNAIRYHHSVEQDLLDHDTTIYVSAANTIAHQCGYSTIPLPEGYVPEFDKTVVARMSFPEEQLVVVRSVLNQEVCRARESLLIDAA